MSEYLATIVWNRNGQVFTDDRYSRQHLWRFDGGAEVPASSSPQVVPLPQSLEAAVDPEEAFVASLSSCHMLWFLSIAQRRGWIVDAYQDEAIGLMAKGKHGKMCMTQVTLRPTVRFSGERLPNAEQFEALHHRAHDLCFIANSVTTEITVEPRFQR